MLLLSLAIALLPFPQAKNSQAATSRQLLEEFGSRIAQARTITVTVVKLTEEFPKPVKTRWWFQQGGYYRYESVHGTLIASPQRSWSYRPTGKLYKIFPGAQKDWSLAKEIGLADFGDATKMPTIGAPKRVTWHGKSAIRVEVDGTKTMTKETKLYYFFDPTTRDEVGVSANLGSMTQVVFFSDLKINPKIDASIFRFMPPKGWHLAKE